MTLEEMIDWCANFGPDYETGDGYIATQIALALRAGQAMQKNLSTMYFTSMIDGPEELLDSVLESLEAWDAATKGETE